ncbi:capsular polysaccharide biosynthesis protein [Rhodonellum psychrophilum GCM71 = DSM 17998]|uniref:Capsular polysaccharide biosynthesis protein n=2 Tax=Rhodonellum TaxID=336827 RepID=U5BS03_9BACT|nr:MULTISPECIES: nucleoside-diphosphate sugar epimerase/dehydratase [Rhodonellum]ERM80304.1 capsular polysaccharide biosynthesis protein [Rhodonellum psychrophilum GCM71 = DSM 17998]SDZ06956.1 NDP-sugar epimerase, includes UDP-GlcNAc-inverting 4,6-dehydratase FlaA1 and capsular polysaccharide biosynthesis protein EpsC [Rhodonellum ikkaensis]
MDFLKKLKILPRWIIAALDCIILLQSAFFGYLVRFNFELDIVEENGAFVGSLTFMLGGAMVMLNTKSYEGIVRHTGFRDGSIIFKTIMINFALFIVFNLLNEQFLTLPYLIPTSVLIIASLSSLFLLVFYRLVVKESFLYIKNGIPNKDLKIGVIFGAGEAGIIAQDVIKRDNKSDFHTIAFLDDDSKKEGKHIDGKRIYKGLGDLQRLASENGVTELIIAVRDLSIERKREIIDECLRVNVHVRIIPPINQWIDGGLNPGAIREVKIEDLLGRDQISLDNPKIEETLYGKVVMVTGAAGSIGSELCRQIIHYRPKLLILVDQAESPLYDIEQGLKDFGIFTPFKVILSDVRDRRKMKGIFRTYNPQVVFHAAAYKHVPMMENYPEESIRCNVLGTKNLADLSVLHNVEKFVLVSTDKAVNPTNVMGATKRAAEMYVQSLNEFLDNNHRNPHTKFITTRFGNVLGSNGSVIPLFKNQILKGGPITVTHPDITRYFMTIPEACHLVLEAGVMGNGGEIYVFDMGSPIKIVDLAMKMIQLSGKKFDEEIKIVYSGLRDGEKLYEELLNDSETVKITHHPKIKIAAVPHSSYHKIEGQIDLFHDMIEKGTENDLVSHLKNIVPEFISNSSRFEVLDRMN